MCTQTVFRLSAFVNQARQVKIGNLRKGRRRSHQSEKDQKNADHMSKAPFFDTESISLTRSLARGVGKDKKRSAEINVKKAKKRVSTPSLRCNGYESVATVPLDRAALELPP